MALSNARRVRMREGRRSFSSTDDMSRPATSAARCLSGSIAGMELKPNGERPMTSISIDIVFAVYCPPHAPGPGHATSSSSARSDSLILPPATAPIASYTSPTATSRPRKRPGMIEPP